MTDSNRIFMTSGESGNKTTQHEDLIGKLAGFRIIKKLGEGGMGKVYLAEDRRLKRKVAIKIVEGKGRARFLRGARAMAEIRHPNICEVFDYGEENGFVYIITPYLKGETLARYGAKQSLPEKEILYIMRQIGEGVQALHHHDVVHRDLKPANIIMAKRPVIIDFGLALKINAEDLLTEEGKVIGTPNFMSPEQAYGELPNKDFDLWALGRIAEDLDPMADEHMKAVIRKALAPERRERYQSIEEFLSALNPVMQPPIAASSKEARSFYVDYGIILLTVALLTIGIYLVFLLWTGSY